MARPLHRLSDAACRASKKGLHCDGGGLYLNVKESGARSWVFVWKKNQVRDGEIKPKRYEMGIGAYPAIRLSKARELASACREAVAEGRNPIAERKRDSSPTFGECVKLFLDSMEGQWRNDKHRAQWRMTLETYCATLADERVSVITTEHVLTCLSPIWKTKAETAARLRGRLERVLDYARVRGWRSGENPARWRGHLKSILPTRQPLDRGHHAAMPYQRVPAFVASLPDRQAVASRALEFLILTASRSAEVLGARWDEIDLNECLWTVPATRMKAGKVHRVPLSAKSMELLLPLGEGRISDFVFPGQKTNRPLSNMALAMLMRRMGMEKYTVHGFRSSFRDWAGDATQFPRELAEQALAHRVGDETERAYRRSDALDRRRQLMEAWSEFLFTS
ncbi:tyrosine-type recombinase/integrase [Mesorhizobium sp. ZMM04-4]